MKQLKYILTSLLAVIIVGCKTPKDIAYFQDLKEDTVMKIESESPNFRLKPGDKLTIIVTCRDKQVAQMFTLMIPSTMGGGGENSVVSYTVNPDGTINFPVIGTLTVGGLTRAEVEKLITDKLKEEEYIQDPVVAVDFSNLYYNVLGEITRPGRYVITSDKFTILDALGAAGDLTIQGLRKNVKIIREEANGRQVYVVDLTNAESILTSPAYYIQQNDVLYVEGNNQRKRQSLVNGNTTHSASFWISVASLLGSMYVIFVK
jgi:polysaccharide export outer membrane protein